MILYLLPPVQVILLLSNFCLLHRAECGSAKSAKAALLCRMLLSFSLVISAFIIYSYNRGLCRVYSRWIFFGMCLSFIGDLAMGGVLRVKNSLATGMLFFMAAHCLYITGYLKTLKFYNSSGKSAIFCIPIIIEAAIALLWHFLIRNRKTGICLNLMSLIYSLAIGMMASLSLVLALSLGEIWYLTALGAALFMASDFIIGITALGTRRVKYKDIIIWLTYAAVTSPPAISAPDCR